jgi:sterol desaturase/sphingolipid hydroxylase (fatty acid hydroxylase superfamily)
VDDILYLAIPLFLALLGLEQALLYRAQRAGRDVRGARREDTLASLAMGVGNVLISGSVKVFLLAAYLWLYEHRLFELGAGPAVWVLLFFAEDFTYYWWHRASHEVRFLWAAHVNHHSSEYYNYSTALRQSYTTPFTVPLFYWWLPLAGFHPLMIFTQVAISLLYQFWIHTETIDRLPRWFEAVFNTPSHHRVHHGANVEYLDRNHGGILILWDRLFGSFEPERARVRYGLTRNLRTYNPLRIAFHEWAALGRDFARAATWRARLGAIFAAPGWSPDGTTKTSRQLRAARDSERCRVAGVPDALAPDAPGLAS